MTNYSEIALVRSMSFLADSQAAIAHNLANANTQGFKSKTSIARLADDQFGQVLAAAMPTLAYQERTNWNPGTVRPTEEKMHVVIDGEYFFRVTDDSNQTFYTRRGDLQIDKEGRLVTAGGLRYLDSSGHEIIISDDDGPPRGNLIIARNGELAEDGGDRTWGPLGVVKVPNRDALTTVGNGIYRDTMNQVVTPGPSSIRQGYLEQSNVQTVDELINMINVQRTFQAAQKALTTVGRIKQSFVSVMMR
jgi:flagellar basal body rod protein FlgG